MNYQAHLHRKSSAGQSLWSAIRVLLHVLETEQNSWTANLAHLGEAPIRQSSAAGHAWGIIHHPPRTLPMVQARSFCPASASFSEQC
jgi:hypothetical protein